MIVTHHSWTCDLERFPFSFEDQETGGMKEKEEINCARKTRAEERRKPVGREVAGARSRKLAAMSTPVSLSLFLFLSFLCSSRQCHRLYAPRHHEISSVALFKLACERVEEGRNEERISERLQRKERKKEKRKKQGERKIAIHRARENEIVKRRSRCDVANEGCSSQIIRSRLAFSFANRDLRFYTRSGSRKFDLIDWTRSNANYRGYSELRNANRDD